MKIAVINIASVDGGGLSIIKDFFHYVQQYNNQRDSWLFVVSSPKLCEKEDNIKVINISKRKPNYILRIIYDKVLIPRKLAEFNPDVVLSMQNNLIKFRNAKKMIYMHQPLPFQKEYNFSFFKKEECQYAFRQKILGKIIKKSVKKADKVFVQTDWIKNAVETSVVGSNVIKVGYKTPFIIKENVTPKIHMNFFYPAGPAIYKNFSVINKAALMIEKICKKDFKIFLTISRSEFVTITKENLISDHIVFLGRISYEEVCKYYSKCNVIFPSFIETLGLPLIEAKNYKCYILASDCPFSKEILEGYNNVKFFPPFDEKCLADYLYEILEEKIQYKQETVHETTVEHEESCWEKMIVEMKGL